MNIKKSVIIISIFILSICMLLVGVFSYSNNIFKLKANVNDSQTSATFLPGETFNEKIKILAGNISATSSTDDTNILSIQKANALPQGFTSTNDNTVSASESANPIYAWFDNGTIYYYSEANNIYLNSNARYMFRNLTKVASIDINTINTSNTIDMSNMFHADNSLTTLNLNNFDTSNVTNIEGMFSNCSSLTTLDLSNFNTSKVTNMSYMFYGCSSITSLNISNFDTSNVTTMEGLFAYCSSLNSLNLSNFNTSKVTTMEGMFVNVATASIDISSFDTSNVTSMEGMFVNIAAESIDISNFDTNKVTNMAGMFWECTNLKTIYVSNNFITTNVTNSDEMFKYSTKLVGGAGTSYNENKIDKEYARVDGGTSTPGYFTLKTTNNNENNNQNTNNNETNTNTNSNTSSTTTDTTCELILKSSVYTIDNDKLEINNVNKDHDMDKIKSNLTSDCGVISISFDKIVLSNDKTSKTYIINRVWFPQTGVKVIKYGLIITIIAVIVVGLFILKKKMK